jgi:hypothetical protein
MGDRWVDGDKVDGDKGSEREKGSKVRKVNECRNQLDWSAFCYLSGEMSPAEAEQFEARLADEQEVREALARAVELTQVVAAAESQCGEPVVAAQLRRTSWTTRISWMAVGGLAAAALAMVWSSGSLGIWPSKEDPQLAQQHNEAQHNELAAFWAETRDELQSASEIGPLHPRTLINGEGDDEAGESDLAAAGGDELLAADAPSWMTVAIEGLASEMDQDEPGSDEPLVN